MRKLATKLIIIALFIFALLPAFATIGVGVGTGKIQVDEKLRPGAIYQLPILTVLNTGDEASDYIVSIQYHQDQPELRPEEDWFIFSPQEFYLEPGEVQQVNIKLNLPLKMEPGDYFAYLEARPLKKSQQGQTSIGVAAAAKLYFTVLPANIFLGIYYKIISFWRVYSPWPQRGAILLAIALAGFLFKKFFNVEVNLRKNKDEISSLSSEDSKKT